MIRYLLRVAILFIRGWLEAFSFSTAFLAMCASILPWGDEIGEFLDKDWNDELDSFLETRFPAFYSWLEENSRIG